MTESSHSVNDLLIRFVFHWLEIEMPELLLFFLDKSQSEILRVDESDISNAVLFCECGGLQEIGRIL